MDAENQKAESGREHQKRATLFNAAEQKVSVNIINHSLFNNTLLLGTTIGRSSSKTHHKIEAVFRRKGTLPRTTKYSKGENRDLETRDIQGENVVLPVFETAGANFERDTHEEERLQYGK